MITSSTDLRELQIFKYYRLVRKWACKTYNLKDADLELLIYLDCKNKNYSDKVYNKAIDDMIKDPER
jgi:hypothetical protein